jgi:hypothetical protein
MTRLLLLLAGSAVLTAAEPSPPRLELEEAIEMTLTQPSPEDAEVAVAKARLFWLQAASGRRIEIGPQTALWTFVNPLALATNFGASLLGPNGSVSPLGILDAEIDVLAAEVAARRRRFEREVEVTDRFNALVLRQQLADRACQAVSEAREQRDRTAQDVESARSTTLDVLWQEQTVLDRELNCRVSEQERAVAAAALTAVTHRLPRDISVANVDLAPLPGAVLQPSEALYNLALAHRSELKLEDPLEDRIVALWDELEAARRSDGRIVLKGNGAFDAEKRLLGQKLRRLESQGDELKLRIRSRIAEVRIRLDSLRDQLALAKKRQVLAEEQALATQIRLNAGLASPTDLRQIREIERQAEVELARLQYEGDTSVASLVAVVGLRDKPLELQKLVYETAVLTAGAH